VQLREGVASWYDDAGAIACPGDRSTLGVANKTLPCGTKVRVCYIGCATLTVDDRGPYIAGRDLDLNPESKAAVSCTDVCGAGTESRRKLRWGVEKVAARAGVSLGAKRARPEISPDTMPARALQKPNGRPGTRTPNAADAALRG
jgi:rare lipoprotein A (peptidoglycan hydrolase)